MGSGLERWKPWTKSHPMSRSRFFCSSLSTPSATTSILRVWASSMILRTIAVSSMSSPIPSQKTLRS